MHFKVLEKKRYFSEVFIYLALVYFFLPRIPVQTWKLSIQGLLDWITGKRNKDCEYHHQHCIVTVFRINCCGYSQYVPHCLEKGLKNNVSEWRNPGPSAQLPRWKGRFMVIVILNDHTAHFPCLSLISGTMSGIFFIILDGRILIDYWFYLHLASRSWGEQPSRLWPLANWVFFVLESLIFAML